MWKAPVAVTLQTIKNCHLKPLAYSYTFADEFKILFLGRFTECSLTYVEVEEADRLTKWVSRQFPHLLWVDYEQINPLDAFGRVMTGHFARRNSPLRCISTYPTIQHHERRFLNIGMKHVEVKMIAI